METKRLINEVINQLAKIDKSEIEKNQTEAMNKLVVKIFNELLESGCDVIISKNDLTMLYSLNIDLFLKTINDQVFKKSPVPTPVT